MMVNQPFTSKRAPIFKDVPDEKWNDWRWQLSNRINTPEEFERIVNVKPLQLLIYSGLI